MKRILIALALALGATAAVAEPTLDKRAERARLEQVGSDRLPGRQPARRRQRARLPLQPVTACEPKGSTS